MLAVLRVMAARKFKPLRNGQREPVSLVLGAIFRKERLRRGWSQSILADISGVRRQSIDSLEKTGTRPRTETTQRLARAFGIPGSELEARAERRVARWPAVCEQCSYFCLQDGRLLWLNARRVCMRPEDWKP
jgi:transcriptional regulator with XRE-family HTH domain